MKRVKRLLFNALKKDSQHQLVKYAVVGLLNNLRGYLIYLFLTWLWLDPKIAVALMYPIGAVTAYLGHARYSFNYSESNAHTFLRYTLAHLIGFGTNIGMLYLFWNQLGYPHQLVQAVAIVVVAGILFFLFRNFVFPKQPQTN